MTIENNTNDFAMKIFENNEFGQIRIVQYNHESYFVAKDIATALGYKVPKDAISSHCKGAVNHRLLTNGGIQDIKIIPEFPDISVISISPEDSRLLAVIAPLALTLP
jgi:prophage antirepressor-like protein